MQGKEVGMGDTVSIETSPRVGERSEGDVVIVTGKIVDILGNQIRVHQPVNIFMNRAYGAIGFDGLWQGTRKEEDHWVDASNLVVAEPVAHTATRPTPKKSTGNKRSLRTTDMMESSPAGQDDLGNSTPSKKQRASSSSAKSKSFRERGCQVDLNITAGGKSVVVYPQAVPSTGPTPVLPDPLLPPAIASPADPLVVDLSDEAVGEESSSELVDMEVPVSPPYWQVMVWKDLNSSSGKQCVSSVLDDPVDLAGAGRRSGAAEEEKAVERMREKSRGPLEHREHTLE